jgi:hypothetical protein
VLPGPGVDGAAVDATVADDVSDRRGRSDDRAPRR